MILLRIFVLGISHLHYTISESIVKFDKQFRILIEIVVSLGRIDRYTLLNLLIHEYWNFSIGSGLLYLLRVFHSFPHRPPVYHILDSEVTGLL